MRKTAREYSRRLANYTERATTFKHHLVEGTPWRALDGVPLVGSKDARQNIAQHIGHGTPCPYKNGFR